MSSVLFLRRDPDAVTLNSARTVRVDTPGTLTIRRSSAWLTVDGEAKDRVLQPGERLTLTRGHRLVMEPWAEGQAVELRWEPALAVNAAAWRMRAAIHHMFAWPKVQR